MAARPSPLLLLCFALLGCSSAPELSVPFGGEAPARGYPRLQPLSTLPAEAAPEDRDAAGELARRAAALRARADGLRETTVVGDRTADRLAGALERRAEPAPED